ncbi:flavin-containing monooxygenase [Rossellomorea arthrocnemi]|uniref:flavin-containing monooxygenase n=1 Tax=Rossellomorea arthrocnemi TaxID=2769542 RepID=UPI001E4766E1|nr:NAD(P)/FAD-dependent oxidoreductase [Rossellomorea arthrocnemi]
MSEIDKIYDVIVVGGGQAGLSLGYHLKALNLNYIILDESKRVGDSWRNRYDSLVLFTPREYSALPGKKITGDPDGFPSKDEIADYLEDYAEEFQLNIQLNSSVNSIKKESDFYQVMTGDKRYIVSRTVVTAIGPFQKPFIPNISQKAAPNIQQLHTSEYTNPSQIKGSNVLIVGAGNSGVQIAIELSENFQTTLSVGKYMKIVPSIILGKSLFWWFDKLRIARATKDSFIGRILRKNDPIIGKEIRPYLKHDQIRTKPRTVDFEGEAAIFSNDETLNPDCILWATGYRDDYSMVDIPELFKDRSIPHDRGVTNVEGFYLLGRSWQYRRGSALLLGVGKDAEFIANKIKSKMESKKTLY